MQINKIYYNISIDVRTEGGNGHALVSICHLECVWGPPILLHVVYGWWGVFREATAVEFCYIYKFKVKLVILNLL